MRRLQSHPVMSKTCRMARASLDLKPGPIRQFLGGVAFAKQFLFRANHTCFDGRRM
jgi:hypothetical protein